MESRLFDLVVVSSDDPSLRGLARSAGAVDIKRPQYLADDFAPKLPAIHHALSKAEELQGLEFDTVVDLDATSPLRFVEDIVNAVNLLETKGVKSVFTGSEARRSPYFNQVMRHEGGRWDIIFPTVNRVFRRQDSPKVFDMNASIYVWERDALFQEPKIFYQDSLLYEMPQERSMDIDSPLDFELVSFLMQRRSRMGGGHGNW